MGPRRKVVSAEPSAAEIRQALCLHKNPAQAAVLRRFFKTGPGEYGAGDEFWGLKVPQVRAVLAQFPEVSRATAGELLDSPVHEVRLCGALALVRAYAQGGPDERAAVFDFYLSRSARINNWDLVDASAPGIVGRHLPPGQGRRELGRLVRSASLWERRVAMVATLATACAAASRRPANGARSGPRCESCWPSGRPSMPCCWTQRFIASLRSSSDIASHSCTLYCSVLLMVT